MKRNKDERKEESPQGIHIDFSGMFKNQNAGANAKADKGGFVGVQNGFVSFNNSKIDSSQNSSNYKDVGMVKLGNGNVTKFKVCPYCGCELNLPKTPKFCPYCGDKLSMSLSQKPFTSIY